MELEDAGTDLYASVRDVEAAALAHKADAHVASMNRGVRLPCEQVLDVLERLQAAERRVGSRAGSVQLPR